ncbi:MAG: LptA/OstA family protein [Deltaproteobacteria bacterium]|nr:LptA/OstA family protein [Deltaproteobacteria bacterium]
MRACETAFLVAALSLLLLPGSASGDKQRSVEIEADRLQIDHRDRSAKFEGNVVARYGELTLRCESMRVSYDDRGSVVALRATGSVTVSKGDTRATAATGRLDARQGLLVLEGSAVLVRGPHRLEGKRISVHLTSGRLDVERARGVFQLDLAGQP